MTTTKAALVLGMVLAISTACTQDATRTTSADAPPEAGPVTSRSDGGKTIYLWDPQTGDADALYSVVAQAEGLADAERSPDGTRVVYEHRILNGPSQIYVAEADGTGRPLTDLAGGAYDPAWSPDGKTIAFSGRQVEGSDFDIYTVELAQGEERWMAGTWRDDTHPDWSPDGSRIVFDARSGHPHSGTGDIWVTSVRTHELHRLTPGRSQHAATAPAWSPDGRWIAYREYHRGYTGNGWPMTAWLKLMRPDGSHVHEVVVPRGELRPLQAPSWSPDGRWIVVERTDMRETESVILLVDPRTAEAHRISKRLRDAAEPSWGTDGILLTLWSDDPVPSEPAPRAFPLATLGGEG